MIKIAIIDNQTILRDSIKLGLERNKDIRVVATGSTGKDALDICRKYSPDIVLMDIKMPKSTGVEVVSSIKNMKNSIKILILTTINNQRDVLEMLHLRVDGYLLKDIGYEQLIDAIKSVNNGICVVQPAIREILLERYSNNAGDIGHWFCVKDNLLSGAEIEIIRMIARGKTNKEIARSIKYAEGTVRNKISSLYQKLEVIDRTQLAFFARENQLV